MEHLFEILILGCVLSADSFSAAVAMGTRPHTLQDTLKFAALSGGAEAAVTFIGNLLGAEIFSRFSIISSWVSFLILLFIAIHMAKEAISDLRNGKCEEKKQEFHNLFTVVLVSIATSLDAFGVGVTLGVSNKPIIPYLISIGLWAFFATVIGMAIAKKVSNRFGPIFTIFGSLIILVIAINNIL